MLDLLLESICYIRATYDDGSQIIFRSTLCPRILEQLEIFIEEGMLPMLDSNPLKFVKVEEVMLEIFEDIPEFEDPLSRFAARFIKGTG
jgi:hypothetical protein